MMSNTNDMLRNFVKNDKYYAFRNNWENTSEQKMIAENARRQLLEQEALRNEQLEERRKRLHILLVSEEESYLKELEALRAGVSDEERLQRLRQQVAKLRQSKEARKITESHPVSAPAERNRAMANLCVDMEDQLKVKKENLRQMEERDRAEESEREKQRQQIWSQESTRSDTRRRENQDHGRRLRDLMQEESYTRDQLRKRQEYQDQEDRLRHEESLTKELESNRASARHLQTTLGNERRAEIEEREQRSRGKARDKLHAQQENNRIFQQEVDSQEKDRLLIKIGEMTERRDEEKSRLDERADLRARQKRAEQRQVLEEETLLEEGRRERDSVLQSAQERLKQEVAMERSNQVYQKDARKQREAKEKNDERLEERRLAEDWEQQVQYAKDEAKRKQQEYARELAEQINLQAVHRQRQ